MTKKETARDIGLLLLRVAFGGFMLVHGWQKLSGFQELVDKFPDPLGVGKGVTGDPQLG